MVQLEQIISNKIEMLSIYFSFFFQSTNI